jgi:hypothetical protein
MPDTIVNVLKADICTDADVCDVDPWMVPTDATIGADVADLEAVRIFQGRQFRRHWAWCGVIEGGRRWPIKRVVRPLMGARLTAALAALLLSAAVGRWGPCGCGVQRPVQAVMTAMLLRCARLEAFREDPESDPPGRALRPSGQGMGRDRAPMIGAETAGQAELVTQAGEDRCGLVHGGGVAGLAGQQETTVAIGHGEGRAGAAVARVDVAFNVSGPELMGRAHVGGRFARRPEESTAAFPRPQPVSAQDLADRGACRPGPWGMACGEDRQPFLGPPSGVMTPGVEHGGHHRIRRLAWARVGLA